MDVFQVHERLIEDYDRFTTSLVHVRDLAYMVPIVDSVLRDPDPGRIKAIVVYPMNALANSQYHELERYLEWGLPKNSRPVTFGRYTGQENAKDRQRILANKPDILLTNYVMLEYLLTRPEERRKLIGTAQGLRFSGCNDLSACLSEWHDMGYGKSFYPNRFC